MVRRAGVPIAGSSSPKNRAREYHRTRLKHDKSPCTGTGFATCKSFACTFVWQFGCNNTRFPRVSEPPATRCSMCWPHRRACISSWIDTQRTSCAARHGAWPARAGKSCFFSPGVPPKGGRTVPIRQDCQRLPSCRTSARRSGEQPRMARMTPDAAGVLARAGTNREPCRAWLKCEKLQINVKY